MSYVRPAYVRPDLAGLPPGVPSMSPRGQQTDGSYVSPPSPWGIFAEDGLRGADLPQGYLTNCVQGLGDVEPLPLPSSAPAAPGYSSFFQQPGYWPGVAIGALTAWWFFKRSRS